MFSLKSRFQLQIFVSIRKHTVTGIVWSSCVKSLHFMSMRFQFETNKFHCQNGKKNYKKNLIDTLSQKLRSLLATCPMELSYSSAYDFFNCLLISKVYIASLFSNCLSTKQTEIALFTVQLKICMFIKRKQTYQQFSQFRVR